MGKPITNKSAANKRDWCAHFSMAAAPFAKDIADDDLWVPSSKKIHVDRILSAVRNRNTYS